MREHSSRVFVHKQALLPAAAIVLLVAGCPPREPAEPPEPPAVELDPISQVAAQYWAQADGAVRLSDDAGGVTVPGRVRLRYSVEPDGEVEVTHLFAWMDDVDLTVPFAWWEVASEKLRCTTIRSEGAIPGSLAGTQIGLATGAKVAGVTHSERDAKGRCKGKARRFDAEAVESIVLTHDPANDEFGFEASFDAEAGENSYTVSFSATGGFLNRPPTAAFEVRGADVELNENGCPGLTKEVPPIAVANSTAGLEVEFVSTSFDPDGFFAPESTPKRPRVDIAFEQWARSEGEALRPIGAGERTGPLLFEIGREHQILLWITDRQGAEARKFCHFQVVEAS